MAERSSHQKKVIRNYYEQRDAIALQRVQELVTDLYLATGKGRERLKKAVQMAAVHASQFIFLCRFHKKWEPQWLLDTWKQFE